MCRICTRSALGLGPLRWSVGSTGEVDVWFSIEDEPLFQCLKSQVPDEELWGPFDELKQKLSDTIVQIVIDGGPESARTRDAISPASHVADAIEIAKARRWYIGKCEACPPEG